MYLEPTFPSVGDLEDAIWRGDEIRIREPFWAHRRLPAINGTCNILANKFKACVEVNDGKVVRVIRSWSD